MIASLPMYKRPELIGAHNRFWQLIRTALAERGISSPKILSQDADEFSTWNNPALVLSQTCGLPYRTELQNNVSLIGTPDYGLDGCPKGYYQSALVVRKGDKRTSLIDFKGAIFALNQHRSQSGYAAAYQHLRSCGYWFQHELRTGAHMRSAQAVADKRADIASIDAVSWRLMTQYDAFADNLRVLDWTVPTPGLPFITALAGTNDEIFSSIEQAISTLEESDRQQLGLLGLTWIPKEDYLAVPTPKISSF